MNKLRSWWFKQYVYSSNFITIHNNMIDFLPNAPPPLKAIPSTSSYFLEVTKLANIMNPNLWAVKEIVVKKRCLGTFWLGIDKNGFNFRFTSKPTGSTPFVVKMYIFSGWYFLVKKSITLLAWNSLVFTPPLILYFPLRGFKLGQNGELLNGIWQSDVQQPTESVRP